ncbi:hypothetical protein DLAC_00642 [Tieghemostelium lacteum]|uniref:Cytochrome P450 family protein n=1 Tax=Tieghemostelium lacteum TaxID=361077 RepID=A0A152AA88_TIELA|nr:hypothetical protein DLAC_00642 [Tieghemostelium lacteum]|eukprot:KYR03142.1 hypothetical protein DLAC_00642 [Tieghemostelium lacteum]
MLSVLNILFLLLVFYFVYDYNKKNKRYKNELTLRALPVLGHLHLLSRRVHESLFNLMNQYKIKTIRLWLGDNPTLVVMDPEILQEIYVKNFSNFNDRFELPVMKWSSNDYRTLTCAAGQDWKDTKSMVIRVFSNIKIRQVSHIFEDQCQKMIKAMKNQNGSAINIKPFTQKYTFNNLCKYLYSLEIPYDNTNVANYQKIEGLLKSILKIWEISTIKFADMFKFLSPLRDVYFSLFRPEISILKKYINEIFQDHLKTIDYENPRDLMDILITELDIKKHPENISKIEDVGFDLLIAGYESSNLTVQWVILMIANYPEVQEKMYVEIKSIIDSQNVDKKSSNVHIRLQNRNSTPYVNAVIKETMRYKPSGPFNLPRKAANDITIKDIFIPKGTQILHFHYGMMKSEDFWLRPNEFLPERFINDNHSDVFFPFSLGNRNCIGVNLAQDQIYILVANIISNFKLKLPPGVDKFDETECLGLAFAPLPFKIILENR